MCLSACVCALCLLSRLCLTCIVLRFDFLGIDTNEPRFFVIAFLSIFSMVAQNGHNSSAASAYSHSMPSVKMNLPSTLRKNSAARRLFTIANDHSSFFTVHPIDSWTKLDVQKWIEYCVEEYSLGDVHWKDFEMNGSSALHSAIHDLDGSFHSYRKSVAPLEREQLQTTYVAFRRCSSSSPSAAQCHVEVAHLSMYVSFESTRRRLQLDDAVLS